MKFFKYQGTGNDFIMIDNQDLSFPKNNTDFINKLCNRRFGIGADGLILLEVDKNQSLVMKYYNADGNESTMCGNGGRCFALFAKKCLKLQTFSIEFEAIDGLHMAEFKGTEVKLSMNVKSKLEFLQQTNYFVNTGSPHYVRIVKNDVFNLPNFIELAKNIRYSEEYKKEGVNINFVSELNQNSNSLHLNLRTYERGVEDETLSCGTGTVASALVSVYYLGLSSGKYEVACKTLGGQLKVYFDYDSNLKVFDNIYLEGPAEEVFGGII